MRDDFDRRAKLISYFNVDEVGENRRLRTQFEAEERDRPAEEPGSGVRDAHAAYWDGYLHGRERVLARLRQAMQGGS